MHCIIKKLFAELRWLKSTKNHIEMEFRLEYFKSVQAMAFTRDRVSNVAGLNFVWFKYCNVLNVTRTLICVCRRNAYVFSRKQ